MWAFCGCSKPGLLSACDARVSQCSGFSRCRARPLERRSVIVAHGFSWSVACGIFPDGPRVKPMSPTLAGRFLTTRPLGKSRVYNQYIIVDGDR